MMTLRQKLIQQLRSALNKLESPNEELVVFDIHDTEFEYLKEDLDKGVKTLKILKKRIKKH